LSSEIDDKDFSHKPRPDKWSKKEMIGHLIRLVAVEGFPIATALYRNKSIDSATNNHHRFVRGQFEDVPTISCDQDKWNECGFYQQLEKAQVVSFWAAYNRQLVELIKRIPADKLANKVSIGGASSVTLAFLIEDHVEHLEHHLRQVLTTFG
jgi:hypothetical protein